MKLRSFIFIFVAITFIATCLADPVAVQGGGAFGNEKIESISGTGVVKLNGTEVTDQLQVTGCLIAHDAEIGFLDILGEANLTRSHIKNKASVMGQIQATRSTFEKTLTILSQRAIFKESKLVEIIIKKDSAYCGKQVIELRQRTIVDGPIHFESGKGEVQIFPGSQVLGVVSGGKIVKKR